MVERVEVLKPFNKTPQGNLADIGEVIEVEASRKEELIRNGLAKSTGRPETKAAPVPDNKMAPAPDDKAAKQPRK